jgi:UDP-N-acetylmuramate dehydrogenase
LDLFYFGNILYDISMSMLEIKENISLARHTSFGIGGPARFYAEIKTIADMTYALEFSREHNIPYLVLGGGSNILVSDQGYSGLVMHIALKGIKMTKLNDYEVELKVSAGEVWDEVVEFAVLNNLWGIENLSAIPGLAGGIQVQNVGAYGQEASQVVKEVYVYDIENNQTITLQKTDCAFAYRQSIFNTSHQGKYVILGNTLQLSLKPKPNTSYKDVAEYLANKEINLASIRATIIAIRERKLPDPKKIGSAGSFFKNLELTKSQYQQLTDKVNMRFNESVRSAFSAVVRQSGEYIKIPTAFVIDKLLGYKGLRVGGAKIYEHQALVIVNETGQATARDVLELFNKIRVKAKQELGLDIRPEPNFVGFSAQELTTYLA